MFLYMSLVDGVTLNRRWPETSIIEKLDVPGQLWWTLKRRSGRLVWILLIVLAQGALILGILIDEWWHYGSGAASFLE